MATLRAALAEVLPTLNSANNANMSDVIGNKTDTVAGNSLVALIKSAIAEAQSAFTAAAFTEFEEHFHSASKVYPTLAAGVTVNTGVGAWTLGTAAAIVPINTITQEFDIHYINVGAVSANDTYELVLFSDAACTVEVGRIRFTKTAVQSSTSSTPFMTPVLAANSGI